MVAGPSYRASPGSADISKVCAGFAESNAEMGGRNPRRVLFIFLCSGQKPNMCDVVFHAQHQIENCEATTSVGFMLQMLCKLY